MEAVGADLGNVVKDDDIEQSEYRPKFTRCAAKRKRFWDERSRCDENDARRADTTWHDQQ